jgi:hypothetical protein
MVVFSNGLSHDAKAKASRAVAETAGVLCRYPGDAT